VDKKDKKSLSEQFKFAASNLGGAAVGSIVGGLIGGADGAVEGLETGNALNKQLVQQSNQLEQLRQSQQRTNQSLEFADIQRQNLDLKLNTKKTRENLIDSRNGHTLKENAFGDVVDDEGQFVPGKFVRNLRMETQDRLRDQGDQRIEVSKTNTELRREGLTERKQENAERDRIKLVDSFNKDKEVVSSREALTKAKGVKALVNSDSVFAPGAAVIAINRLSGNVGVLSDTDMALFGGSQAYLARINRWAKLSKDGRLTETDRKDILSTIDTLESIHSGKIREVKNRLIGQFSSASDDVSLEKAKQILGDSTDRKSRLKSKLFKGL